MAEVYQLKHTAKEVDELLDKVKKDKTLEATQEQNALLQQEIDSLENILDSINRTVI